MEGYGVQRLRWLDAGYHGSAPSVHMLGGHAELIRSVNMGPGEGM